MGVAGKDGLTRATGVSWARAIADSKIDIHVSWASAVGDAVASNKSVGAAAKREKERSHVAVVKQ
jgi:hypothetical protein